MSNDKRVERHDHVPTGGDVIEIPGQPEELARQGYVIYRELDGKEENETSAVRILLQGGELRPGGGIYAISLHGDTLQVEVRNIQNDLERRQAIQAAVAKSQESLENG